jgi:hypothetical protein
MHTHDSPSDRSSPKSKNSTTPPQSIPQPRRHTIKASKGAEASVSLSYRHIHSFPFPHIIKHNSQPRPCCPLLAVVVTHPPIPQRVLSHPSFSSPKKKKGGGGAKMRRGKLSRSLMKRPSIRARFPRLECEQVPCHIMCVLCKCAPASVVGDDGKRTLAPDVGTPKPHSPITQHQHQHPQPNNHCATRPSQTPCIDEY